MAWSSFEKLPQPCWKVIRELQNNEQLKKKQLKNKQIDENKQILRIENVKVKRIKPQERKAKQYDWLGLLVIERVI